LNAGLDTNAAQSFWAKPGSLGTVVGLAANTLLCTLKLAVGIASSSLALVSDGLNSLTDAVSSLGILIAVHVAHQEADHSHPFGHRRAEPIAGLILAVFAGIAGFEILKTAVTRLYQGEVSAVTGFWPFVVLAVSMLAKTGLSLFFSRLGQSLKSPAFHAAAADSRIDVLISLAALLGVTGSRLGFHYLDAVAAVIISFFIFRTGYSVGRENIDYLMGRSPSPELLEEIREAVLGVTGVHRLDDLKAHYVGNFVHVAVEVSVDGRMSAMSMHDLEEHVKRAVENVPWIDEAFVHVNPLRVEQLELEGQLW